MLESGGRKGYLGLQILFVIPVASFFVLPVMGQMQPVGHWLNQSNVQMTQDLAEVS